jgi:hypothetical protein
MNKNLMTEKERARQQMHANICQTYTELRRANKTASRNRIMTAIARDYNMTIMGIRRILVSCNAYN